MKVEELILRLIVCAVICAIILLIVLAIMSAIIVIAAFGAWIFEVSAGGVLSG